MWFLIILFRKENILKDTFLKKQHKLKNNNPYTESNSLEINALVKENLLSNNDTLTYMKIQKQIFLF